MPSSIAPAGAAFASWVPPPPVPPGFLARTAFTGLTFDEQADKALGVRCARGSIKQKTTYENQKAHLVHLLELMRKKGRDLASIDASFVADFRSFLQECVDGRIEDVHWSESYVGGWINTWNALVDEVFGEPDLKMKYMGIGAKDFDPISPEEYVLLDKGVDVIEFDGPNHGEHHREAFRALLELVKCTGARTESSLLQAKFGFDCIRWTSKTIVLRKVKNVPSHEPVVTNRALKQLHRFGVRVAKLPHWKGPATQVFLNYRGKAFEGTFFSRGLERICLAMGLERTINPHLFRKTLGNYLWGRFGEKVAAAQLGITIAVLRKHYTKANPKDVLGLAAALPGGEWKPPSRPDDERLAALRLLRGEIDPVTYDTERELRDVREAIEDAERWDKKD